MKILNKTKLFLIIGLVVIVVGMAFLGIFGLNKTVDYKETYEIKVSVDQNVHNSSDVIKESAKKYFSDNGVSYVAYTTQEQDGGAAFIYKTYDKKDLDETALKAYLQAALNEKAQVSNLKADAEIYKIAVTANGEFVKTLVAGIIALAIIFIVLLFIIKPAGAVTVLCNSVISFLLFVALNAITRVPALPFFYAMSAVTVVFAAAITLYNICGYREALKNDEKADFAKISEIVAGKTLKITLAVICAAVVFTAIALIFGATYLVFAGLQALIAGGASLCVPFICSPVLFNCLRKK